MPFSTTEVSWVKQHHPLVFLVHIPNLYILSDQMLYLLLLGCQAHCLFMDLFDFLLKIRYQNMAE